MEEVGPDAVPDLRRITLEALKEIPEGKVTSYKDLAEALGDSAAARAVGTIMSENRQPEEYPCWRVVHADGKVGKYSGGSGAEEKIRKIRGDGIPVRDGKIENFAKYRFRDFDLAPPLPKLRKIQEEIPERVRVTKRPRVDSVAGVDVSYGKQGVVASYVEFEENKTVKRGYIRRKEVKFPYIPGYLAFRELPPLYELLRQIKENDKLADVVFVDGNGLLHPRKAGLASHLGVVLDKPTVGVAKNLLCGAVELSGMETGERREVIEEGEKLGLAVKTFDRANPVFVSVGNLVGLEKAAGLVLEFSKYKLPEPLRQAHKLAKREATKSSSA